LKFFRRLQWRLMAVMFLFIICLMIMVGTILISNIEDTYSNSFVADMKQFDGELTSSDIISDDIVIESDEEYANQLFKVFKTYFQIDDTTKKGYLLSPLGEIILPENKSLLQDQIEITENIMIAMSGKTGDNSTVDKDYFDYAKPVVIKGELKYICYLIQGKDTINEIIASLKKIIVYVIFIALGVSIFVSFILSKAITIPVDKLTKSAEKMANGEMRPCKKPDMDNVVKIIADSLNNIAYRDDTQIVDCQIRKFYSNQPRIEVTIAETAHKEQEG